MTSPLNWQDFLKLSGLSAEINCLQGAQQRHTLIRVTGSDAESFLHAQFSNSVMNMQAGEVRFAAWCNAKGRVWTLLRYWKDGDAFILRLPSDQLDDCLKRLRMFVLRSDVQLEPLQWHAIQFHGPGGRVQMEQTQQSLSANCYDIALPAAWPLQELWSAEPISSALPRLPENLEPLPRILAGIPEVFADQREQWIPQMLNLDKLDGIDFKKGCYPGQEIVAKLHYKGGLKQRLFTGKTETGGADIVAGANITDSGNKKIGNVLEIAQLSEGHFLTAVLRTQADRENLSVANQSVKIIEPAESE